jgi:hypothetical protein
MQCVKCNKEFKTKQKLNNHINRKIKCDNKIECNDCKREFKTKQLLRQHLNNKKSCKIVELEQRVEILELKLKIANLTNINNGTINNNTTNNITNININIFGNEDLTHITKKILKEEILKIAEREYKECINKLMEIDGQRYNKDYIKDMDLHLLLTKLIYFTKNKNETIKKENDKYYINNEEGWKDVELEDLNKHQEVLVQCKDLILENKIFRRVVEKYFIDDEQNIIIEANGVKDKLINKKPRQQILRKVLNYELENKKLEIEHKINIL